MSHVAKVDTVILDLELLKQAAKACGLEFRENQKTYRWYGRWVNDYHGADAAYKQGIDPKNYGKCTHAIAVRGNPSAYEIGVVKNPTGDGYLLIWDFYAGGYGLQDCIGRDGSKLLDQYSKLATIQHAEQQGWTWEEVTDPETGGIQLNLYDYTE
jgi:hypothetical protein